MDPTTPLLEQLKFAIIASSNLDEFFMVRVAALKNAVEEGDITPDLAGLRPRQQLIVVSEKAHEMVERIGATMVDQILPALAERGIRIVGIDQLDAQQRTFLSRYFTAEILPALTPLAIDISRPFPKLANLSLNLALLLAPAEGEEQPRLGVVQVPAGLRRLVRPLGGDGNTYVLLEEIIRAELATLFPGQTVVESTTFRIARDAEMELDEEGGRDYLENIEDELRKRRLSRVVRLEVQAGVGDALLAILVERLQIEVPDVYFVRSPLDIRALQPLVELPALEHLREPPLEAAARAGRPRAGRHLRPPARGRGAAAPPVRFVRARGRLRDQRRQRSRRPRHQADAVPHQRHLAHRAGPRRARPRRASRSPWSSS